MHDRTPLTQIQGAAHGTGSQQVSYAGKIAAREDDGMALT